MHDKESQAKAYQFLQVVVFTEEKMKLLRGAKRLVVGMTLRMDSI